MDPSLSNGRQRINDAGVTLLEVMVVLAITALLATFATPRLMANFDRAKSQAAIAQMENAKAGIQLFYIDVGRYPTESESLGALIKMPPTIQNWRGPYLDPENIIDPWGREYIYRFPGNVKKFDLLTLGGDGRLGGQSSDADIYR
ncbi:MAG: type II secretion system major pseudopilin GspG [Pseudoruegeria sp.]